MHGGERRTNGGDAVHGDMGLNGQAEVVKALAGAHFHQFEMFADHFRLPANTAGDFIHRHIEYFASGDQVHALRHEQQRH